MDHNLFGKIQEELPKMNPVVCEGVAPRQIKDSVKYLRGILQCAAETFPEGLRFIDIVRCDPIEEVRELLKVKHGKSTVDLTRSTVYMTKILLELDGEALPPIYLNLATTTEDGSMKLRGTSSWPVPVLVDRGFSVDASGIFIQFNKARLNIERSHHNYFCSGILRNGSIVHSVIHNTRMDDDTARDSTKCLHTLFHYMCCKYGFTEAFERFTGSRSVVGYDEINPTNYPEDEWSICTSLGNKPKGYKGNEYISTQLRVAIPKKDEEDHMVRSAIATFFYVCDHYPDRIRQDDIDECDMWRIVLGKIIKGGTRSEGTLLSEINRHIETLNTYVDAVTRSRLERVGINIKDIWDLFIHVTKNIGNMMIHTDIASMYGKELTILSYLLFDITCGIFNSTYELKPKAKPWKTKDIIGILSRNIKRDAIYDISRRNTGETSNEMISSDNKFIRITSKVVQQTKTSEGYRGDSTKFDPAKILSASQAEVASMSNQSIPDPTGRSVLSGFVKLINGYEIGRNEHLREVIDRSEERIRRS